MSSAALNALKRNKEIMRLAIAQALAPLVLQGPILVLVTMSVFSSQPSPWSSKTALLLFVINSLTNPILVISVVKPYKKAVSSLLRNLKEKQVLSFEAEETTGASGAKMNNRWVENNGVNPVDGF